MAIPCISAGLNIVTPFILPLINRLLITSGSYKSMMCCSLGPLLTSWNLLGPCSSEVQLKPSGAAGGVSYLIADSWSQNRIVTVTHHGVNPQNDTVTRASGRVLGCCEPAASLLLMCYIIFLDDSGFTDLHEVTYSSGSFVKRRQHYLLAEIWNCLIYKKYGTTTYEMAKDSLVTPWPGMKMLNTIPSKPS